MRFSQRKGLTQAATQLQRDGISPELLNSLWNVLDALLWRRQGFLTGVFRGGTMGHPDIVGFSWRLWFEHFKLPADERPRTTDEVLKYIRDVFFGVEWFKVYDLLEWILNHEQDKDLVGAVNSTLERELSGYRFVGDTFTDITDPEEVALLEEALADDRFSGVRSHLASALHLLSNRESPDYRNSIKESVSAVESMAKVITGQPKATLGEALAELEKQKRLHRALKEGFSKLYGYASDEGGIRHAMLVEPDISASDAKFFLLSCTSFTNYLKSML